jgi:hypothetical protein
VRKIVQPKPALVPRNPQVQTRLPAPVPVSSKRPVTPAGRAPIQRRIAWKEGTRSYSNNLAQKAMAWDFFGYTQTIINNTELVSGTANTALTEPALRIRPLEGGNVELSVHAEPLNEVSYQMRLPSRGQWVKKEKLGTIVNTLPISKMIPELSDGEREKEVELVVAGVPDNERYAASVEIHENQHVRDLGQAVHEVLIPWDNAIYLFKTQNQTIVAASAEEAKSQFYAAVGGTPAQVGRRFYDRTVAMGQAFHDTPEGHVPEVVRVRYLTPWFGPNQLVTYWK